MVEAGPESGEKKVLEGVGRCESTGREMRATVLAHPKEARTAILVRMRARYGALPFKDLEVREIEQ